MAVPAKGLPLPGSERPPVPGSTVIGPLEATERVAFLVLLRPRPDGPPRHDFEHWQNTPPGKRRFLSVEESFQSHGATEEDVAQVVEFLRSKNLEVTERHAGRRRIDVTGTVAEINAALDITLKWYRTPHRFVQRQIRERGDPPTEVPGGAGHRHRGFDGPVHLPAPLLGVVTAVIGLDDRRLGGPAGVASGDPPGAHYLSPTAVARLYDFPTAPAAGQTVALFEAADDQAAYLHSDITDFIASLPAGHNTPPNLTDIGLTVGLTTYGNDTSLVTGGPPFVGGVLENTLDVAVVAAVAQGANINVYFTEDTEAGWLVFLDRAIFPLPGDNPPSVISASWILTTSDDAGTIGSPSVPGTLAHQVSVYLQSAAMRGITVFMAIGDWGSANQNFDGRCHVSFPNSDPWTTACGGTIIGDIHPSPATFDEWTWSDGNTTSPFENGLYEATGGGVSDTFPIPPYQSASGILPLSQNDGNARRGLPDVAGMVAMDGFFFNGGGGPGQNGLFGTSAVSPLYAGLIAVINGVLGHDTGFLNPTLYAHGPAICRDIRIGNNYSGYTPAPFYTADVGWDPCTGWGSLNGRRLLAALAPAPILVTALPHGGFGEVCRGGFADETLTLNNTGFGLLLISDIVSSSPDFAAPAVAAYPLAVSPGGSLDVVVRFQPTGPGAHAGTLTITSNDLSGPHVVPVSGTAPAPRLVLVMADGGDFGPVCVGSVADEPLVLNNSGKCPLSVTGVASSSGEFRAPTVLHYPLTVGPGDSLPLPIRFAPAGVGPHAATLTVHSDDPAGARSITVSGETPAGRIAVTGSALFGGVPACGRAERAVSVCNVGDCKLHVAGVAFKRQSRHWKLVNNPFPATLAPGSCLSVVLRYHATEHSPRSQDLVITSDDPATPVKTVAVVATTLWRDCCRDCCEGCRQGTCERRPPDACCRRCHGDRCDEEDEED